MKMTQADLHEWQKLCEEQQASLSALTEELGAALKVGGIVSEEIMHRWNDIMRRMTEFMKAHPVS
ncbi:MAG: hypothetical protein Q7O12_03920 [Deltaproteobacteria bacterium]|nr:hypothetical protein [Deltaproteobacteria bacterium]